MWSGSTNTSHPNWSGEGIVESDIGNLYVVPNPPTIEENPSIGLEGRNEVPLPTKYKDLDVKNLTAENFNGIPVDISKWSEYPAIHDVVAERTEPPFNLRQYNIDGFYNIKGADLYASKELLPVPNGGHIYADVSISAPLGNISTLISDNVYVGGETHEGSLIVKGGTTLDGGVVHGTSIGCLPVGGINTMRLDVLPIGIDMTSPLYVSINALGVGNFACGGALSLSGGDYIEYNSDEHYFINTSAGNDFTDIYVGNIHPAYNGTDNLRINAGGSAGRYVRVDDGLMIQSKTHKASQFDYLVGNHYDVNTEYVVDDEVDYQAKSYKCLLQNSGFLPTQTLYNPWDDTTPYVVGNLVQQLLLVFRCIADITGGDVPVGNPTNWVEVGNYLTPVWEFIENFEDNQFSFKTDGDTYGWSLIKKKGQEGIRIMRNNVATTDFTIGRLYDDTFNTITISNIPITGDLNMGGYNILDTQKVQVSQVDLSSNWVDNQVYVPTNVVIVDNKVYRCREENLNLNPTSTTIPLWDDNGVSYLAGNITSVGTADKYRCILAYTTALGDPTPPTDPTHWTTITPLVPPVWNYEQYYAGDYAQDPFTGLNYKCINTTTGLNPLVYPTKTSIMTLNVGDRIKWYLSLPSSLYNFIAYETLVAGNSFVLGDPPNSNFLTLNTALPPSQATGQWVQQEPPSGVDLFWEYQRDVLNGGVEFPTLPYDTDYYTLVKPSGSTGLWISERDAETSALNNLGQIYDTAINPPTIGNLPVSGNLQMNGYSVLGALNIQPSQYDLTPDWADNNVYYVDDLTIAGSNKIYKCLSDNLNLYPLSMIQYWGLLGVVYSVGNITTIGGGYNYICILGYTSASGDPAPNSDPTHWSATTSGDITAFWELVGDAVRGGLVYQPTTSDATYMTLIKPQGLNFLGMWEREVGTNDFVNVGAVYDTTYNPPLIGGASSIAVGGTLNMVGQDILNMGTAEVGEYDTALAWDSTTLYNGGEVVYADVNKIYTCISFNLNVDPALPLSDWVASTPYEIGNAIKSVSSGYIYVCILAYAGGTTPPVSDPTHWNEAFITGNQEQFWAYNRIALTGGVDFKTIAGDYSQFSLIRPATLPLGAGDGLWITQRNAGTGELQNAGLIYDTAINVPVIGGATSLSVLGDLNMVGYSIDNVNNLSLVQLQAVSGGTGYISVLDQLEGNGKSIQNFNFLKLVGPATGDNATIDLRTTADDIGLQLMVDADTGDATISANISRPLTITTDNQLYLTGSQVIANNLNMTGNIDLASNDIVGCNDLTTNSINLIANLFRRGNFANFQDQTFTASTSAEQQVIINSTMGTTNGISLNTSTYEIEVDADGSYKVDMSYQLTSSSGTTANTYFWVKRNGTAIAGSTNQIRITGSGTIDILTFSRIFQLDSGDKLTFYWNSSNNNDRLFNTAAQSSPFVRPAQPSVAIAITSC